MKNMISLDGLPVKYAGAPDLRRFQPVRQNRDARSAAISSSVQPDRAGVRRRHVGRLARQARIHANQLQETEDRFAQLRKPQPGFGGTNMNRKTGCRTSRGRSRGDLRPRASRSCWRPASFASSRWSDPDFPPDFSPARIVLFCCRRSITVSAAKGPSSSPRSIMSTAASAERTMLET